MADFRKRLLLEAKKDYEVAKQEEYRTMIQYKTLPCEEHSKEYWLASNKTTMARSKLENILRENVYRRFTPEPLNDDEPPRLICDFWGSSGAGVA